MDLTKLQHLRADLRHGNFSQHRRLRIATGLLLMAVWVVAIAAAYYFVSAM